MATDHERGLTPELRRDMILSVGTHRGARRLSPPEYADAVELAISAGQSFEEIARLVGFESTSTLREIYRLRRLPSSLRHLVSWGRQKDSMLSMTAATHIARLAESEQEESAELTIQHQLSSTEVRQLAEARFKSGLPLAGCIETILAGRGRVVRRYVIAGAVTSPELCETLAALPQIDRDALLRKALEECYPGLSWDTAKLGATRFTLLGSKALPRELENEGPDFESHLTVCLEARTAHG